MNTPSSLPLLTALSNAASGAHTRTAITRRLAEALTRFLPLAALELAWIPEPHTHAHIVRLDTHPEPTITELTLPLPTLPQRTPLTPTPEGLLRITLPLFTDPDSPPTGFATLFLTQPHPTLQHPPLIEAITSILSGAQHNTRLIERVARLAQRAHREKQQLARELQRFSPPEHFVASSPAMRRIANAISLVARHDTTVLLRGQSGTGKERLARILHARSSRANRPFITVNCGALPENLIESELFGHEKGAFTGASSRHLGRFERAHTGTLLLDEVAELPLSAQVKLLRVLQEGEVERVGGEHTISVDVRVIAATHQPLEEMVEAGSFRADLYYRLNVFPLHIPPLRERKEDIQTLSELLLLQISERLGRTPPRLPNTTLARLTQHPWPGNVRELENALERAIILSRGASTLEPHHLDPILTSPHSTPAASSQAPIETLETATRRCIERALTHTHGRIYGPDGAALLLDLKPSTLQSRMKKLGINRDAFTP